MKKKILLGLLVLVGLFTITGCAGDNGELSNDGRKKISFYDILLQSSICSVWFNLF